MNPTIVDFLYHYLPKRGFCAFMTQLEEDSEHPERVLRKIFREGLSVLIHNYRKNDLNHRLLRDQCHTHSLTKNQEKYVLVHITKSSLAIAQTLGVKRKAITPIKCRLALIYLRKHYLKENDHYIGVKFGLLAREIRNLRHAHGLFRKTSGIEIDPKSKLGTREEIEWTITCGGKTLRDIADQRGVSRECIRLQVSEWGLSGNAQRRTTLWYAHRLVGPKNKKLAHQLIQPGWLAEQINWCAGSPARYAQKLGVTVARLNHFRMILKRSEMGHIPQKPLSGRDNNGRCPRDAVLL